MITIIISCWVVIVFLSLIFIYNVLEIIMILKEIKRRRLKKEITAMIRRFKK